MKSSGPTPPRRPTAKSLPSITAFRTPEVERKPRYLAAAAVGKYPSSPLDADVCGVLGKHRGSVGVLSDRLAIVGEVPENADRSSVEAAREILVALVLLVRA